MPFILWTALFPSGCHGACWAARPHQAWVWYRMNEPCLGIPGTSSCICYPLPTVKHRQMFRMANPTFPFLLHQLWASGWSSRFGFVFPVAESGPVVSVVCSGRSVVGPGVRSFTDLWLESFSLPSQLSVFTHWNPIFFPQKGNNHVASLLGHVRLERGSCPWRCERFNYIASHRANLYFLTATLTGFHELSDASCSIKRLLLSPGPPRPPPVPSQRLYF